MTIGIVDTTVILHLLRRNELALNWFDTIDARLDLTSITWLEVMYGVPNKMAQIRAEQTMQQFTLKFLVRENQLWAMEQMKLYRLSRGVAINDCLIASVCHRLNVPIYTHNTKDFLRLLPAELVIKPY